MPKREAKKYRIFMGGKLNAILPGETETQDVTDLIKKEGVYASNDLYDTISIIKDEN